MTSIVIDMGGTSIRLGHVINNQVKGVYSKLSTEQLREAKDPLDWLAKQVKSYATSHNLSPQELIIGVPFTPNRERTTALSSPNIKNLEGAPIKSYLEAALELKVTLERDINLLLLGEWQAGAVKGAKAVFGMFVGTGIGGSFLQEGVPYRGATGAAVELGHIPIRTEGRLCVCGNTDCLEAYACGHTLIVLAQEENIKVEEVFLPTSNPSLIQKRDVFVRDLAYALATVINLFQPDVALVGGGIPKMQGFPKARFQDIFLEQLRKPIPYTSIQLRWASLDSEAALWGAVALQEKA